MATKIFVNLPVKDLNKSVDFFTTLGYSFNPEFTDENATSMIVSDDIYVMLLVEPFFKTFIDKGICDTSQSIETITCLSCDSREEVDAMLSKAIQAGATVPREPNDMGFMYSIGFYDLDGHYWEYVYMNMGAAPENA